MTDDTRLPNIKRENEVTSGEQEPPKARRRTDAEEEDMAAAVARSQKASGDLLTAEEKKANHIASEKKRRQAIREGFDKITSIVPDLDPSQGRSEAIVLTKTVDFLQQLIEENNALKELASKHNIPLEQHLTHSSPEGSSHSQNDPNSFPGGTGE